MKTNLKNFDDVECELVQSGYSSLEISSIWKDKKLLKKIISGIEESRNLSLEELEKRLIARGTDPDVFKEIGNTK